MSPWIDDGYEDSAEIAPVAGLHGGLKFKYRSAPDAARFTYRRLIDREYEGNLAAAQRASDDEAAFVVATLAKQVVSWEGRATVDEAGVKALHPALRQEAFNIVIAWPKQRESDAKN